MNRNNIWGQANIPFLNIPLSQFCLISFVSDNITIKGYLNGILIISTAVANGGGIGLNSLPLMIGKTNYWESSTDANFEGVLNNLRIYNRALTDSEIQLLYNEK